MPATSFSRRRALAMRSMPPIMARPPNIRAQVPGSGAAETVPGPCTFTTVANPSSPRGVAAREVIGPEVVKTDEAR